MNETHDPKLRSWIASANEPDTDFPIQNLPFGIFQAGPDGPRRGGVAIGDRVLDVAACAESGLFSGLAAEAAAACDAPALNSLMSLGVERRAALRRQLSELLRADNPVLRDNRRLAEAVILPLEKVTLAAPAEIGDFTDFYASIFHATNVGRLFRPDNPLLPNYKYVPIAYHGRSSSVIVSGEPVRRPRGQLPPAAGGAPAFEPCRNLDYELEAGFFTGPGNRLGTAVPIAHAEEHIFGLCLINDWSARDIQRWEYQPLGPFLAKSFATTISPWVVTFEALEPFRCPSFERPPSDPPPLGYLDSAADRGRGGIDLTLEILFSTEQMRRQRIAPVRLSLSSMRYLYWTAAQMVAHHTSNGCNLRPGDLIGTGTISGPTDDSLGCLLELTRGGRQPVLLPTGETRRFLEDGDEVVFRGYCEREGFVRIGCGECRGIVTPAG